MQWSYKLPPVLVLPMLRSSLWPCLTFASCCLSLLLLWLFFVKLNILLIQGMIAGHAYYFLEDVYPRMTGRRPLKTPSFIKALFADEAVVVARPVNVRFAPPPAEELHRD